MYLATGKGDNGTTTIFSCTDKERNISKTDPRINYIGLLDTIQAQCIVAREICRNDAEIVEFYDEVSRDMYDIMGLYHMGGGSVSAEDMEPYQETLETFITNMDHLPRLKKFIIPKDEGAFCNMARTKIREVELATWRLNDEFPGSDLDALGKYLNRLSVCAFITCIYYYDKGNKVVKGRTIDCSLFTFGAIIAAAVFAGYILF